MKENRKNILKNKGEKLKLTTLGFTLIELLAVIIILAAIALIVAPLVLDIIKEQKMKTFKESINGVLRSSRLELVNSGLSFPATFTYSDGKLVSPSGKELKVTGKIMNGTGTVTYYQEDNIELFIHDNDWCGSYNRTNKEVEVNEYTGTCGIVFTPEKCFEFDTSTGTITDYFRDDDECTGDVVIPNTISGTTVKEIGDRAFSGNELTSVTIPSSVTNIGNYAFSVNHLTSVDLSGLANLQEIGVSAFAANQLTNVTFGSINQLTKIYPNAFCNSDGSLPTYDAIPSSVVYNAGFSCDPL